MMKAAIFIDKHLYSNESYKKLFKFPNDFTICGKNIITIYLDYFLKLDIKEVYINSEDLSAFKKIEYVGLDIKLTSYETLEEFYTNEYEVFSKESLLCIRNFGLVSIGKESLKGNFCIKKSTFSAYFIQEHKKDLDFNSLEIKDKFVTVNIDTLKGIFLASRYILKYAKDMNLPSYNLDDKVLIGKNVEIQADVNIIKPVIINDDVKICKGTSIGPYAIIEKNSIISSNCVVKNSVVNSDTFINEGIFLDKKLVFKKHIYDFSQDYLYQIDGKFINHSRINFFQKILQLKDKML